MARKVQQAQDFEQKQQDKENADNRWAANQSAWFNAQPNDEPLHPRRLFRVHLVDLHRHLTDVANLFGRSLEKLTREWVLEFKGDRAPRTLLI